MIDRIRGTLLDVASGAVVVETGGVGLRISVSSWTAGELPQLGSQVRLLTHLAVREDDLQLFGFADERERDLFGLLLGVQSIGPKLALAVLSGADPDALATAIATGDAARLQATPGVGKRTAERIVVELRDKVAPHVSGGPTSGGTGRGTAVRSTDPRLMARQALEELGFAPDEIDRMLGGVEGDDVETLVAAALKRSRA